MKSFILIFLLSLSCSSFALSLSGVVVDNETNKPVEGVNVLVQELQVGCITADDGTFTFSHVAQGRYTITLSYLGYKTQTKQAVLKAGKVQQLSVRLDRTNMELSEVVVACDKYEELKKMPVRVDLVSAERIEASPETMISGILDNLSGVNVDNALGVFSSRTTVSLRGISGDDQSRTLVLMDGIRLNTSDGGSVNWNLLNKENVDAMTVIKGCGPAKYGSNAMGGVIDVITKKPSYKLQGFAKLGYGTYNTRSANIGLSGSQLIGSTNRFYWSLMNSSLLSDGYIVEQDIYTEGASYVEDLNPKDVIVPVFLTEYNTNLKLGYNIKNKHNVEIFANYYDDRRGNGIKINEEYGDYTEHDTWFSTAKYDYNHHNLEFTVKSFLLQENYGGINEYYDSDGNPVLYEVTSLRQELGAEADFSITKGIHTISSGFSAKQGSVDAQDIYYTSTDLIANEGRVDLLAVYLQDRLDLSAYGIQVDVGLRYDYATFKDASFTIEDPSHSLDFLSDFQDTLITKTVWDAISPRLSIQKRFNDETRIYISYGKGFKAPLLDDLCRTAKQRKSFRVANPHLKPETVHSFDVGVDYSPFEKFIVKHSVYYTLGNDFMALIGTGDTVYTPYSTDVYHTSNISQVQIYGVETDVEYQLGQNFTAFANYTYNISQILEHVIHSEEVDEDLSGKYLTNIPNHKVSTGFMWHNRILDISMSAKYVGSKWINDLNELDYAYTRLEKYPAYILVSAKLERQLWNSLDASLSVDNIFDNIYVNQQLERCPGRTFTVQLKYNFNIE